MTFTWRRTFPDTHRDFVAEDAGQHVGRIKRIDGGPQDSWWTWTATGVQRGHEAKGIRPLNGLTATRDEAIEALAAAWARAKAWSARTGLPLAGRRCHTRSDATPHAHRDSLSIHVNARGPDLRRLV